jgi:hypothetical protein
MPISTQQDIYKTVKERQAEFAALYARMDGDKAGYCAGVVKKPRQNHSGNSGFWQA